MNDAECVTFLQWALPRLRLRWPGFRKVRRQVCRRIDRRRRELGLPDLAGYRAHLEINDEEWAVLDGLCRVTISRFYRDRGVYELLEREVTPELARRALARGETELRAWSAGCASGEEPYTLALMWELTLAPRYPGLAFTVLATDLDDAVLGRARAACFGPGSLKDLPDDWWRRGLVERDGLLCVRPEVRRLVTLRRHDVRTPAPDGPFDLVLCRNLAFTYFDPELQLEVARLLARSLRPGGALVVGAHETLPAAAEEFEPWQAAPSTYRRLARQADRPAMSTCLPPRSA